MESISVLQSLREFEKEAEGRLKTAQDNSKKKVEEEKKALDKKLEQAKTKALQEKEELIKKAEQEAKEEAKRIIEDYNKKRLALKKLFLKNKEKSIEKIFEDIFKENV